MEKFNKVMQKLGNKVLEMIVAVSMAKAATSGTEGIMKAMFSSKVKMAAWIAAAVLVLGWGSGVALHVDSSNNPEFKDGKYRMVLQNGCKVWGKDYQGTRDRSIGGRCRPGGIQLENLYYQARALLCFDLGPIPQDAKVASAKLSLHIFSYPKEGGIKENKIEMGLHRLTETGWKHKDPGGADWERYENFPESKPWKETGGDFEKDPLATASVPMGEGGLKNVWIEFDLSTALQCCLAGKEREMHLILIARSPVAPDIEITSAEEPEWWRRRDERRLTFDYRPKLVVTYEAKAPVADAGPYCGGYLGRPVTLDGTGSVNPNGSAKDLVYKWRLVKKPEGSKITDADIKPNNVSGAAGADRAQFTIDALGEYELRLEVVDKSGLSGSAVAKAGAVRIKEAHPRIWLTDKKIAELRVMCKDNDPEWAAFQKEVDAGEYKSGDWWGNYMYANALAYLVTGEKRYGDQGLKALEEVAAWDVVKGVGGYLGCYFARLHGLNLAVGYDWLWGHMAPEQRHKFCDRIAEWVEFLYYHDLDTYNAGWGRFSSECNFSYGRVAAGVACFATYGDYPGARQLMDLMRDYYYERVVKPGLQKYHPDGGWFEDGNNYSPLSVLGLFRYLWGVKTATGEDLFADTTYPERFIYQVIHSTMPTRDRWIPIGELAEGGDIAWTTKNSLLVLASEFCDRPAGGHAMWYYNHCGGKPPKWAALISRDRSVKELTYDALPRSYLERGQGWVFARSDWGEDATWVSLHCGGKGGMSHEFADQGAFNIYKREWLVAPAGISFGSENGLLLQTGKDTHVIGGRGLTRGIRRFEDRDRYVYAMADLIIPESEGRESNEKLLGGCERHLVFVRPDYVVLFDRVRPKKAEHIPVWVAHFTKEPQAVGNFVKVAVKGKRKGKVTAKDAGLSFLTLWPEVLEGKKQKTRRDQGWSWSESPAVAEKGAANVAGRDLFFLHLFQADSGEPNILAGRCLKGPGTLGAKFALADGTAEVVFKTDSSGGHIKLVGADGKVLLDRDLATTEVVPAKE